MDIIQAIIIAIVEGMTEFLPISSTGHMALTASFLGIEKEVFTKLFIENIQFGTILSVMVLYWRKFLDFGKMEFYYKLFVAFLPAAVIGILLKEHIDRVLESPVFIASTMLVGGIILLFVDNWFKQPKIETDEKLSYKTSFIIGCFQILSIVFPGLSRSAATIIGGMQQKLTRQLAAEFSFFLAVPTLAGAFVKSLWDTYQHHPEVLTPSNIKLLALGNFIGFVVALLAIKIFINYLQKHGFKLFGYYRIVVGVAILVMLLFGYKLSIV
jgi:undecaprenyl-diphosphatase